MSTTFETVGVDGQIVIEKEIRDQLGIKPGWQAVQRLEGNRVVLEFRPPKHNRSLAGVLAGKAKRTFPTPEALEAATDEAWTYAAREAEGEVAPDR